MTAIHAISTIPNRAPALRAASPRTRRRARRGLRGLAIGYRRMAWNCIRAGDAVGAAMYAACSRAMLAADRR